MMNNVTYPITKLCLGHPKEKTTITASDLDKLSDRELSLICGTTSLRDTLASWSTQIDLGLRCDHQHIQSVISDLIDQFRAKTSTQGSLHREIRSALEMLIANMIVAEAREAGRFLGYSRKGEDYTANRYNRSGISHRAMKAALAVLRELGLSEDIEGHQTAGPGCTAIKSRLRGLPELFLMLRIHQHPDILTSFKPISDAIDPVRRKNAKGRLIDYEDTAETNAMRAMLRSYNAFINNFNISIPPDALDKVPLSLAVDCSRTRLYRVFNNGSFEEGGRFYGGWWQEIPRRLRPHILIDGEPTRELDFGSLVAHQAYATVMLDYWKIHGDGDPYEVTDIDLPRTIKKLAFQCMLNTESRHRAAMATAKVIKQEGGLAAYANMEPEDLYPLLDAIIAKHEAIAGVFYTVPAGAFQFQDSVICENVLMRCMGASVPVLPVHDSFIVPESKRAWLKDTMDQSYKETLQFSLPRIALA